MQRIGRDVFLIVFIIAFFFLSFFVSTQVYAGEKVLLSQLAVKWPNYSWSQKVKIVERLIKMSQFGLAQSFLDRMKKKQKNAVVVRFLQGALYKNIGYYKKANKLYRGLLASDPKLHRVRLELAHTLFLMKDDKSARHHFDLVMAAGTSTVQKKVIQSFINAMDKRKTWNINAYVTVAPSTNMNQGTDNTTVTLNGLDFTINESSKRKSGVGLNSGLSAGVRLPLAENLDLAVSGGGHYKRFRDKNFDDLIVSGAVGPRYRFQKGHISLSGTVNRRWYGQKLYSKAVGVSSDLGYRLSARDVLATNIMWERRRYDVTDYQNSDFYRLFLRNDHYLNSHSFIRTLGAYSKENSVSEHLTYKSWEAGLGFYKELPFGVSVYTQGQYTKLDYEGIFPGSITSREDKKLNFSLQLIKRDWNLFGYAPSMVYNYTRSDSNIAFYEFDSHSVNFTLSKNF